MTLFDPMQYAIQLARKSMLAGEGGPFAAVIVKSGEIIGEGWNRVLTTHDPTAHGEVMAIRDACKKIGHHDLSGCEIYTTGQPCPMCLGAIYWARLSRIYYGFSIATAAQIGFDDSDFFEQIQLAPAQRRIPAQQILTSEADSLAAEYAQLPHKQLY